MPVAFERLAGAVGKRLAGGVAVPLLVVRAPEFAQLEKCVPALVRGDDVSARERGGKRIAVAMLSASRSGRAPGAGAARAALRRLDATISAAMGRRVEMGWWTLSRHAELQALATTLDAALERGAHERKQSEMLATVGHELRTPLTSIRGYLETLIDSDLDAATTQRFLETARREALRLGRLVEGMLEFSMLDLTARGRGLRCDVAEQLRAAIDAVVPLARERRVTLCAQIPCVAWAWVDGDACTHALVNLMENGVKYCRDGGRVEVSCIRDGRYTRVNVDDDGPGVAVHDREAIFAMGIRGRSAQRTGTGIGLAVVKAIADRAGGAVRVLASPLGGARFTVAFRSIVEEEGAPRGEP